MHEPELCAALGLADEPVWLADGCNDAAIIEVADEAAVRAIAPDFAALKKLPRMAVVTARGDKQDIVEPRVRALPRASTRTRSPAPRTPRWCLTGPSGSAAASFTALQASKRSGLLHCRQEGDRVVLGGQCHTVIVGQFQL